MTMNRRLRAIVVGAGFAGEGHTLALRHAGVEVVALCARRPGARQDFALACDCGRLARVRAVRCRGGHPSHACATPWGPTPRRWQPLGGRLTDEDWLDLVRAMGWCGDVSGTRVRDVGGPTVTTILQRRPDTGKLTRFIPLAVAG